MAALPDAPRDRQSATSSSCGSTRWPSAAPASRAPPAATSCSSTAASPATSCARACTTASAPMPRRARCERARARTRPRGGAGRPSRRALAGAALRAPARDQARARSTRRCGGSASSTASRSSRSCPRSSSGATATSSSTPSGRGADGTLLCGFHAPGSWERIDHIEDCLLASEPGNEARRAVLDFCRAQGLEAFDRRTRSRLPAQPRRARGAPRRPAPGPPRDGRGRARRRRARRAPCACDGLLWTHTDARAETTAGGRTELIAGAWALDERIGELELRISPDAFFQTNTEMAERLYALVARGGGAARLGARV